METVTHRDGGREEADVQYCVQCKVSHKVSQVLEGPIRRCGSRHMVQVNNRRKVFFFFRIPADLWGKAQEMMLQVLCIASP